MRYQKSDGDVRPFAALLLGSTLLDRSTYTGDQGLNFSTITEAGVLIPIGISKGLFRLAISRTWSNSFDNNWSINANLSLNF